MVCIGGIMKKIFIICIVVFLFSCDEIFENGLESSNNSTGIDKFCCDLHYVQWWKSKHPHEILAWDISNG